MGPRTDTPLAPLETIYGSSFCFFRSPLSSRFQILFGGTVERALCPESPTTHGLLVCLCERNCFGRFDILMKLSWFLVSFDYSERNVNFV